MFVGQLLYLSPVPSPCFALVVFQVGSVFMPRPASDCNPPTYGLHMARVHTRFTLPGPTPLFKQRKEVVMSDIEHRVLTRQRRVWNDQTKDERNAQSFNNNNNKKSPHFK
jgi:hypothetical protein